MTSLPLVYVISKDNLLSRELIVLLTSKGCRTALISSTNSLKEIPNYVFFIDGIDGDFFSRPQETAFLDFIEKYTPKTQVIIPYVVNNETRQKVNFLSEKARRISNRSLQIIYLGEIFESTPFIKAIYEGKAIPVSAFDVDLYLISKTQAARTLVRGIFSYGFPRKEMVAAYKTSAFAFLTKLREINPLSFFLTDPKLKQLETVPVFEFIKIKKDNASLKQTVELAMKQPKKVINSSTGFPKFEIKPPKIKLKLNLKLPNLKPFGVILLVGFWILLLPFISLFAASLTLKLGFNELYKSNFSGAKNYFNISEKFSSFSNALFFFSSSGKDVSHVLFNFDISGLKLIDTLTLGEKIYGEVTGAQSYDLLSQSNELYLDMDYLYKRFSFLSASILNNTMTSNFIPLTDLSKLIFYLGNGKEIVKQLPKILGEDRQTNYLVLVQDPAELWPTGGKINSFGVLTFKGGRLVSKTFYDTKQADGQLRGQVDAPFSLQKYLGIKSWNLANSNWDPDFPTSSSQAAWFLEKELGQSTDGVISVNGNPNFLLPSNNLGSWGALLHSLEVRNLQIFAADENIGNLLTGLNWDGGVNIPTCDGNKDCVVDFFGIVEANLGENQVNPFIKRKADLNISLQNYLLQNKLVITYTNTSTNLAYRDYIRVVTSKDISFYKATEVINDKTEDLTSDTNIANGKTEVGVLIQIPANETGQITFYWGQNTTTDDPGKIKLYLRKQSGVDNMQTSIVINGTKSYNTNLETDFVK